MLFPYIDVGNKGKNRYKQLNGAPCSLAVSFTEIKAKQQRKGKQRKKKHRKVKYKNQQVSSIDSFVFVPLYFTSLCCNVIKILKIISISFSKYRYFYEYQNFNPTGAPVIQNTGFYSLILPVTYDLRDYCKR